MGGCGDLFRRFFLNGKLNGKLSYTNIPNRQAEFLQIAFLLTRNLRRIVYVLHFA